MASRYGGITGSKRISEDFQNINTAFENVQADVDELEKDVISLKDAEMQDNMIFFELPNGIKNTVAGNSLTKNVAERTLQESDIIGIFDGVNISLVRIAKPADYIGFGRTDQTLYNSGYHEFGINFRTIVSSYDRVEHIGKMLVGQSANQIWYIVEKNSLTLEAAKTLLIGTKIWYQLTAPVQVPLKMSSTAREILSVKQQAQDISSGAGIKDNSITASKRTRLGELALITVSSSGLLPDHNTTLNTIKFSSNFFVFNRNTRYTVTAQTLSYLTETDPSSSGVVIYFDTANSTFIFKLQNQLNNIPESALLFAIAYKVSNQWYLTMNCEFTVNGKSQGGGGGSERPVLSYSFPPDVVEGFFVENKATAYQTFNNANDVIQAFIDLASNHSNFLTETLHGNDSSGNYPIYRYRSNPGGASTASLTKGYPKIIWVAGQHGSERTAVFASYYFMKNLLENWKSDPVLEWLRWNFIFEFIPLANPWGYDQGDGYTGNANLGRLNSNGVNLNRNWGSLWQETPTGADYAGTAPFSEVETQYMRDLVDRNTNAIAFIDFHTNNSTGNVYNNLLWISANEGFLLDENLLLASKYTVEKQSREFVKKYGLPTTEYYPFGYVSASNVSSGSAKAYGATKGIPSTTFECFRKFPTETEYYSNDTIQACTEYFTNFIKTIIMQRMNVY